MKTASQRRLLCTTAVIGFLVMPSYAIAGPEGGAVTSGGADITQSGNTTTINQATDRAIIRWDSFDLNAAESVRFNQPDSSSITVNRIRDTKASQINGHIGANGNIVLINPNGLVFGATSTVDVGSLVATTSDIENDAAFMNGSAVAFTKPGAPDARIVNNGGITVKQGGLVGLVAPNVENHGIIQARLGKVALASGDIATVDFAGDGLIKLEVTDAVLSQEVLNTGTIQADGGDILLTAAQARGMVDALITNTGTLQARTVTVDGIEEKGDITISTKGVGLDLSLPRGDSIVFNTGTIDASGLEENQDGGDVLIIADKIAIGDGSYVTAAADHNGGTIRIGGDYQGGNGVPTSDRVFIAEHAILNSGSRRSGRGGNIILWSDTNTRFYGHADVSGIQGGGFIEISGKKDLDFAGTVDLFSLHGDRGTLLLDPTDIVISNAAGNNMNAGSPFTPVADNGATVLNITTLLNALASGNVIVQTRATGAQPGNITVNAAITWAGDNTLTLDAHNNIVVNQAITGNNLSFIAGNDLQLNANVSGAGTLTIQQAADSGTVGIGASAVGTMNLNAADLTRIVDGWNNIVIGKSTATAAMDVRAVTFADNLTLLSGTGAINFNATLNMGANNLSIVTNGDIVLPGALTGTGVLTITQASATTGMGFGASQTGAVNLTNTEIGKITNGWSDIILGRTDGTGILNFNTLSWNDNVTIRSGTGVININGTQTMTTGNNLTIVTDADIVLTGNLTGSSTSNLTVMQASDATTMGFGNGQSGTINLTTAEVGKLTNGWASLTFGRLDGTGAVNIGALTWNDNLTIQSGSGVININGNQILSGATLTYQTDADMVIGGTLTGTLALSFLQTSAGTSIGLGDGQSGTLSFSDADIAQITDGWASISFGRIDGTQDMNVGTLTWNDSLVLQTGSGIIDILGAQSLTGGSLTLRTDADVHIGANLGVTGTGSFTLIQSSAGTSMGLGTGQAGTVHLDDTELGYLLNGWSGLTFGRIDGTAALNVSAQSWDDPLSLRTGTGALNINGAQTMAANNLTLTTDSDVSINGALTGSGSFSLINASAAGSMGIGDGQAGTIHLSNAELSRLTNGWSYLYFGNTNMNGDMNIGAWSWVDRTNFRTLSGLISINGNQNYAGNAVVFTTNSDIAINGTLTGTGALSIIATTASTTVGIGTGQAGTMNFSDDEISRMANTFSSITIGSTSQTGAINIGASTWKDPLVVRNTSGQMSVNGDINMGANSLTLTTNSNIILNGNLIGTGSLNIAGTTAATTMGIGTGQAGTIAITDDKLARIAMGWSNVIFGSTSMTGALNIAGKNWAHSVEFRTNSGALNINGVQNMGTNNLTIRTNTNLALSQNLVGAGTISIMGSSAATTIGIGDGQAGTLNLTNAKLAYILDGWSNIIFGSTSMTGAMNIGARTWTDNVDFRSTTGGVININGIQNTGTNNLTIRSNTSPVINAALTGSGVLSFIPVTDTMTVGVGSGSGTFSINDARLNQITDGWSSIVIGSSLSTGAMTIGARTWSDNVVFNTAAGVITISGAQAMGANNLTIRTSGNLALNAALSGTGTLTIEQNAVGTTMGVGNTSSGTININTAELDRITDGWANLVFGRTDGTGVFTLGAYNWKDNATFQTGTGIMTVSGAQNAGANNLTFKANSNLAINADLAGTGHLTIGGSAVTTSIGVGDAQSGTLALTNAELTRILNGWNSVTIGSAETAGLINIGTYTWLNPMSFLTKNNIVLNGVQTSTATSDTTLVFAATNGSFINNAGANAINPGGGRYLVYSVAEATDTLGGIVRPGILTDKGYDTYGPALVTESGSLHIYSGIASKILYLTIDDVEKIYGDALPVFTYTYTSGLINDDLLSDVIGSYTMNALGASVFDNAGTARTITGTFTLNNGYGLVLTNGTLTVTKATLTVEADPTSRTYGSANPIFSVSYDGFKNGEDETDLNVQATASSTANLLSDVGTYAITSAGASAGNYNFVYIDGVLNVTKATLIATMQNASREYGSADPAFTATYTGFKNGNTIADIDVKAVGASNANATSNVGSYTITGSGAFDNNYTFSYVNGTLNVTKATLLATANDVSREYGDSNPALTITYTGFKNGENDSVIDVKSTASSGATAATAVGTSAITVSGGSDNNYNITHTNGALTITKATLTATAGNASRDYGEANPAIGVTYSGFKNSETDAVLTSQATASSLADATSNVSSYATTANGGAAQNYNFVYANGTLNVTKATLTATAGNVSRDYGEANPAIGVTYSGFKNSETDAVLTSQATASSLANATSNVGSYATTAGGGAAQNYDFVYADGILTVTKATLTATAGNVSRDYGEANPAIGVTYSGFKNSETDAVLTSQATASSLADATSNVGSYATTANGGAAQNYNFVYANGTLNVTKATLTATAGNASREYGEANPAIGVTYSGFKNSETDAVLTSQATASSLANATSNVGSYATTAGGGAAQNYDFVYADGILTVTKATLLATADNTSRTYGSADPVFTATYTGFKNGENASVINTLASAVSNASLISNTGLYTITMSGAADDNYDFTYANGILTIDKAMLTAAASSDSRKQGQPNPPLTVSYSGFKNSDTMDDIDILATATTNANIGSAIGTYATTASGAFDNNYDFTYVNGVLTVLDPVYVPPPPATGAQNILPSTVTNPMPSAVYANGNITTTAIQRDDTKPFVVLPDTDDFEYHWEKDHFLIAMTSAVEDYFLIQRQEENNRP